MKSLERQAALLKAAGRLEALKADLARLDSLLESAPLWTPVAGLRRQCAEALRLIEGIAARLDRSLIVVVVGPSGAGKSTLVNALAGGGELSPVGRQRPTTGDLIVLGEEAGGAAELAAGLQAQFVRGAAGLPASLCLVDTPDTDSMDRARHLPALARAVVQADVLICVFDAENPKRRDHADFLAPLVQRFDGQSLVAVLNKCDRLEPAELESEILPDFREYLQAAWQGAVDRALCVSARRHIAHPDWDAAALPRHGFDQFGALREIVCGAAGTGSLIIDRRLDNASQLRQWVFTQAAQELGRDREAFEDARRRIAEMERAALAAAAAALAAGDSRWMTGAGAAVYLKIAQKWVGPVGWLIAAWARLLVIGSGIAALFRPGRGWFGRAAGRETPPHDEAEAAVAGLANPPDGLLQPYRRALLSEWPQAAEILAGGRFDPRVRRADAAGASADRFAARLAALWGEALEAEIDRRVRALSGMGLQALANAPVVGVIGHVGWTTVSRYFAGSTLPGDFFVHALWVIGIVLVLSFIALQIGIRWAAGPDRLAARAFERLKPRLAELEGFAENDVMKQLDIVCDLARRISAGG